MDVPLAEHDAKVGGIPSEEHLRLNLVSLLNKEENGGHGKQVGRGSPYAHAAHVVHVTAPVAAVAFHGVHMVAVIHCEFVSAIS